MAGSFAVVLVTPWLQTFFQLRLVGTEAPWAAAGTAAVAAVGLWLCARSSEAGPAGHPEGVAAVVRAARPRGRQRPAGASYRPLPPDRPKLSVR